MRNAIVRHMALATAFQRIRLLWQRITWIALCSVLLLFAPGCGTVMLKDNLPPDAAKGYVAFQNLWLSQLGSANSDNIPDIYSLTDHGKILDWHFSGWSVCPSELRLAKNPGPHHFLVRYERFPPCEREATVTIQQGMVTPIMIDIKWKRDMGNGLQEYTLQLYEGNRVPVESWSPKRGNWFVPVNTNEWRLAHKLNLTANGKTKGETER